MDKYVIWYFMGQNKIKFFEDAEAEFNLLPETEKKEIAEKALKEAAEIEALYEAGKVD